MTYVMILVHVMPANYTAVAKLEDITGPASVQVTNFPRQPGSTKAVCQVN